MRRRQFTLGPMVLILAISQHDAAASVRLALQRGDNAAVDLLGRNDGLLGNPKVRIPLPGVLNDAANLLKMPGREKRVDARVTAMNRAADAAVAEARPLLVDAPSRSRWTTHCPSCDAARPR